LQNGWVFRYAKLSSPSDTVQKKGWWNKVVQDVRAAVAVSPVLEKVVAVIPHDVDRDGPKDPTVRVGEETAIIVRKVS
jgi:hypothetical protein